MIPPHRTTISYLISRIAIKLSVMRIPNTEDTGITTNMYLVFSSVIHSDCQIHLGLTVKLAKIKYP